MLGGQLWKELPWEGDMVRAEPLDRSHTENTELAKRLLEWYLKVSTEGGRSRLPNYLVRTTPSRHDWEQWSRVGVWTVQ